MPDSIGTLLFKDKQARLLLTLFNTSKEWYISDLAKTANVTYIHTSRFIGRCEEAGMIRSEKHGRMKRLVLTEKGRDIAQGLASIMSRMQAPATAAPKQPAPQADAPKKEAAQK